MKVQFSFIITLFLIVSCQRNTSEGMKIDEVITFNYECEECISQDIDSVVFLLWRWIRWLCIPIVQK